MTRLPPLKLLVPFCSVARHLSFSRAADELCVTHSAVSQSVRNLESYLGQKLFQRKAGLVTLTSHGEVYYRDISQALTAIESVTKKIKYPADNNAISINMLSNFAMRWLIPRLPDFQQQFPHYQLRFLCEWREVDFDQEEVDLALQYGNGEWLNMSSRLIFDDELALLCSPDYLSTYAAMTLSECLDRCQFLYVKAIKRPDNLSLFCHQLGVKEPALKRRTIMQNSLQCLQAAMRGQGIIAGNKHLLEDELKQGVLVPAVRQTVRTGNGFYIVCPQRSWQCQKNQDFTSWILWQSGGKS